jgi:hypothetical protein
LLTEIQVSASCEGGEVVNGEVLLLKHDFEEGMISAFSSRCL